jgi:hypothetical protein
LGGRRAGLASSRAPDQRNLERRLRRLSADYNDAIAWMAPLEG